MHFKEHKEKCTTTMIRFDPDCFAAAASGLSGNKVKKLHRHYILLFKMLSRPEEIEIDRGRGGVDDENDL